MAGQVLEPFMFVASSFIDRCGHPVLDAQPDMIIGNIDYFNGDGREGFD